MWRNIFKCAGERGEDIEPAEIIRGQRFRKRLKSQLLQSAGAMGLA
jgi:hypothetical protein